MKTENQLLEKSFDFAVRIVNVCKYLREQKKEHTLSKQILRSGTSIGANINEAQAAQSKKEFIAKLSIASKEARETKYWIDLMIEIDYLPINSSKVMSLNQEILELIKLLTSIIKTLQDKN